MGAHLRDDVLVLDDPFQSLRFEASCFTRVLAIGAKPFRDRLGHDLAELDRPLREALMEFYSLRWHELAERHHRALFVPNHELLMDVLFEAATWISAMSHPEGTLVKAGREFLARRLGCSRVTVSRSLARLVDDGRVRLEGRRILLIGHQGRGTPSSLRS